MKSVHKGFAIRVTCDEPTWWRYNVTLLCGCFDEVGTRIGFCTTEQVVASVGSNLSEPPAGFSEAAHRTITLETVPAPRMILYLYVVPHTLPTETDIATTKPFVAHVAISYDGNTLKSFDYNINRWAGAAIELKLCKDGSSFLH
jgi:hypothetical protein